MTSPQTNAAAALAAIQNPTRVTESAAVKLLQKFVEALRETSPHQHFTVQHVMQWAITYKQLENMSELPSVFNSGYSLGKFMRRKPEWIGIEPIGSYGNRIVYRIRTQDSKGVVK